MLSRIRISPVRLPCTCAVRRLATQPQSKPIRPPTKTKHHSKLKSERPGDSVISTILPPTTSQKPRRTYNPDGEAIAFTTAREYNIDNLRKALWEHKLLERTDGKEAVNIMGEAIWIPKWPLESSTPGEIFIFESGSFVTWGLHESVGHGFLKDVIRGKTELTGWIEQERHEIQTEEMGFVVRPNEPTSVKGDTIVIGTTYEDTSIPPGPTNRITRIKYDPTPKRPTVPRRPPLHSAAPLTTVSSIPLPSDTKYVALPDQESDLRARLSLSSGLARSTRLAIYEEMLDQFLDEVENMPAALAKSSSEVLNRKQIMQRTGKLLMIRQALNMTEANILDPPDLFWTNSTLQVWFEKLIEQLEIPSRLRNLNTKLDYCLDEQSILRDLETAKTSHRLEWIIILLIAFEIFMVLAREGVPGVAALRERLRRYRGEDEEVEILRALEAHKEA